MDNVNALKNKTKNRMLIKGICLLGAMLSLVPIMAEISKNNSNNIFYLVSFGAFVFISMAISTLDAIVGTVKEYETFESTLRIEKQRKDIDSLHEKFQELNRKYDLVLKEIEGLREAEDVWCGRRDLNP